MKRMHISDQKNVFYDIFTKLFLECRMLLRFILKYLHERHELKNISIESEKKHSQTTTENFSRLEKNVKISIITIFYVLYF